MERPLLRRRHRFHYPDYKGVFIVSRTAFTQPFLIRSQTFEAKLSGHYAGLFPNGFIKIGNTSALCR